MAVDDTLVARARALGVETSYDDVDRVERRADPEALRAVVEILDADARRGSPSLLPPVQVISATARGRRLHVDAPLDDATLLVDGVSDDLAVVASGGRSSGRHEVLLPDDLAVGCHTLSLASGAHAEECLVVVPPATMPGLPADRRLNALFVPSYALWGDDPLPSYRHLGTAARLLHRLGIDQLATLPLSPLSIEQGDPSPYSPVSRLHWNEVLIDDAGLPAAPVPSLGDVVPWTELAARRRHQLLRAAADADDDLIGRLDRHRAAHPDVGAYARFRARRDAGGDLVVERSHVLAQLLCDEQLADISGDEHAAGLGLDLPVGSHPAGFETWAFPDLFASGVAVGAPPDTFFTGGQNWGFPPQLPGEMVRTGFELWRRMIERIARHAELLRIDHVMAVHRLWWVPDGMAADRGVYVRYPRDQMLAVIAATAAAAGVALVGEDLGTVPPEVDDALAAWEMLGMYEEQFTTGDSSLAPIPARSVAGVRTHDMSPFAEHVRTHDLDHYRRLLAAAGHDDADLLDAVLGRLAASDAHMIVADLDDLLGDDRPHNIPGRVVDGLWQRRLDRPISEVLADPTVVRRLDRMRRRR